MTSGDDDKRLLSKVDVIQRVTKATRAWVKEFVIHYNLCPFADSVFGGGKIQYKVMLEASKEKIVERLRFEVLNLLCSDAENTETTLLMLPFALPNFKVRASRRVAVVDCAIPDLQ